MGTMRDWLHVLFAGTFWGGAMFWIMRRKASANLSQINRTRDVLIWVLSGLLFGILTTFHLRQALTSPLVFITFLTVLGVFLVKWAFRDGHPAR